ncbi:MAG: hypothetical protein SFW07_06835 [Gammaproteobacteria bacterium]|nr:hypothetical protein [Gammaproteobacteria bacterium]
MNETVVEGKRYNIYVSNNTLKSEIFQSPPHGLIFKSVDDIRESDLVVVVEDESFFYNFKEIEDRLQNHPQKEDVIVIFLADQIDSSDLEEYEKNLGEHDAWRQTLALEKFVFIQSSKEERKKEFEEALIFLMTGSPKKSATPSRDSFPRAKSFTVPAAAAPNAAFFGEEYPANKTFFHTRQLRREYLQKSLRIDEAGISQKELQKRLILLFAHYMSIRHVNSAFSKAMEDVLIKHFKLNESENVNPAILNRNKWWKRAYIRGKKYDPVALKLRAVMLEKFSSKENQDVVFKFNFLIDILQSVDLLEKGYLQSKSKKQQITHTMNLAERTSQYLFGVPRCQQGYSKKWREDMAYSAEDGELNLPRRVNKCLDRWVLKNGLGY